MLIISNLIFGFHHLWYLSALAMGLIIVTIAQKVMKNRKYLLIIPLAGGGVLFTEYYKLLNIEALSYFARIVSTLGGSKHAVFFATPMLLVGDLIARQQSCEEHSFVNKLTCIWTLVILFAASFCEATILKNLLGSQIRLDVSLFGWTPSVPLLILGLNSRTIVSPEISRKVRKVTDVVYIIHVWVIEIVDRITRLEYTGRFLIVTVISFAIACFVLALCHTMHRVKNT